jgi:hypothetical protein
MGDGSAIAGWILAAAIITVLAGGASTVNSSSSSSSGSSGSGSSGTGTSTPRPAPTCTKVTRSLSTDSAHYKIMPISAGGSVDCRLELGNSGQPVTVLQRALLMCSNRDVAVDGTFSEDTRGALARDQDRQLALPPTGVYDPPTARAVRWPWYTSSNNTFTGLCGQVADRAP